ncbi:MAG: VWA domain-containing protein [Methanomethylophilus sp.]|jgi:magnesium chelatase subunit D
MPGLDVKRETFPFSAIVGNESAKTALLCAAVSPSIKTVLIKGLSGTGKTALARSVTCIDPGKEVVNVPLNATDEQIFGAIDMEKAIATGKVEMAESVLMRADGNYAYMDDADLFDPNLLIQVLDSVLSGTVKVERENVSAEYRCDTKLLASMNSTRKYLDRHVLDMFDISVSMRRQKESEQAEEIIRRTLRYGDDDEEQAKLFAKSDAEIAKTVKKARKQLKKVHIPKTQLTVIARLCKVLGVKGCRGAVSTAYTAMALCALGGRTMVSKKDTARAAVLCLGHRRTIRPKKKEKKQYNPMETGYNPLGGIRRFIQDDKGKTEESQIVKKINEKPDEPSKNSVDVGFMKSEDMEDVIAEVGETFEAIDLLEDEDSGGFRAGDDAAKRKYVETQDRNGKYIRSRIPKQSCTDIAFDATVRAAAPYQKARHERKQTDGVILEKQDLREKVRQKQVSSTFLFLLDTSGSLIIRNRMSKVKASILSMLETHYVKRDRVGLMTFNEEAIELILAPTRAVEQLEPIINDIAVGQGTPLSEALVKVYEYMMPYTIKHPDERCHIVLITDGKATASLDPNKDPVKESIEIAEQIHIPNADWIVIDTGLGYTKNETPRDLAAAFRGKFFLLDDLEKKEVTVDIWD